MSSSWSRGSEWHRWDPHIHTPATILNNQFGGDWETYLDAIERSAPTVEAIGVTEYCTLLGYKEFCKQRDAGRAKNVRLAFPNIEFRLDLQTEKKRGINIHLLFSPDDPNHEKEIERALSHLSFEYKGRVYPCSPEALLDLGKAVDQKQTDRGGALRVGVEQFKLDFKQLKRLFEQERWVRQNCLVAVEVSEEDGTSGLQKDGAFKALREEIEAFAHMIFSPRESDREFWLGRKPGKDRDFIERTYRNLKPCLHGSDAHRPDAVLKPEKDRYCWIRADLTFTGLRQTLLEPESRVHIGLEPPIGAAPSDCVAALNVGEASWLETPRIELNSGLVAIIGPKGSGKTALADIVAQAAGAPIEDGASFLLKASDLLGKAEAALQWSDGAAKDRAKKHTELQRQVAAMKQELDRVAKDVEDAKQSDGRRKKAVDERRSAYAEVFGTFAREQAVLEQLYSPLQARLASGGAGPRRLDFRVQRHVDIDGWVARGEDLLDLRRQGPFQGKGKLAEVARQKLLPTWKSGDAAAVAAAMEAFLSECMRGFVESRAAHTGLQDIGRWLFSTEHVSLAYGVTYDGVEISRLSPGMRGIVLLILYLAVDQWDLRPLIVDQPEENLDPQSVYDELVGYFRDAKKRRQVILVTHNPNLVVNADADQIIVAHATRDGAGLPTIQYTSGGLEDAATRADVCRILEGGARAFREREQRYAFGDVPRGEAV